MRNQARAAGLSRQTQTDFPLGGSKPSSLRKSYITICHSHPRWPSLCYNDCLSQTTWKVDVRRLNPPKPPGKSFNSPRPCFSTELNKGSIRSSMRGKAGDKHRQEHDVTTATATSSGCNPHSLTEQTCMYCAGLILGAEHTGI